MNFEALNPELRFMEQARVYNDSFAVSLRFIICHAHCDGLFSL